MRAAGDVSRDAPADRTRPADPTGGDFRSVGRLFAPVERIPEVDGRRTVTKEAAEAARESLVIGPP